MSVFASTALGKLQGQEQGSVLVFRGVPYAKPPVGRLRFRAPEPPAPWVHVRDAGGVGPTAPQNLGMMRDLAPQDEDCLYANIWTPSLHGAKRPVLVFIHGGGFTTGASTHPMYDGRELARRGDVVVVSFNYRLGALGFADVAALAEPGFAADSNLGLRDQLAALRFVQQHIADFGGDPARVTLFGQSAGAMSVCTLLVSPAAKGLFARAIAQSGAGHYVSGRQESERIARRLLDALEIRPGTLSRLRELPWQALVQAQSACLRQWIDVGRPARPLRAANMTLLPVVDGDVVPELPVDAATKGHGGDVPLLLGWNRDEYHFWVFITDPKKRELDEAGLLRVVEKRLPGEGMLAVETYRALVGARAASYSPWEVFSAIETDRMFRVPAMRFALARQASQTYAYAFEHVGPLFEGKMGSCHTMEVPFVLGLVAEGFGQVFSGGGPEAHDLSARIMDAWLAFARDGEPSTDALGVWPRYAHGRESVQRLSARFALERAMPAELEALWAQWLA